MDELSKTPLDVTVLMGGPSSEREVSLMSGAAVAEALEQRGHRVTRADITPMDTMALDRPGIEVVFIALHGDFGESGAVQQLCEEKGLRYTGSGPRASRLGMDKAATKQIFLRAGLSTPPWMIIEKFHSPDDVRSWLTELTLPVVVKPVDNGSSVDVTICRTPEQRDEALEEVVDTYGRAMVEAYVRGREVTVGILGDEALPVIEVVPGHEFYDYSAKYADDAGTRYVFDHGLSEATVEMLQRDALLAHRTLGCRDLSRVDFILNEHDRAQVLELNTIPGFTGHSLVPKAAAERGIEFPELCERIVRMAWAREGCPA